MHRLVIASLTAAGLSVGLITVASAADLGRPAPAPVYTKAPPVVPFSWSGFYIGANVGADWEHASFTSTEGPGGHIGTDPAVAAAGTGSNTKIGFSGGGQIGYNWQFNSFVLGAEADVVGLSGKPSIGGAPTRFSVVSGPTFTLQNSADADWLATVRGRAGFAVDRALFYATGGAAFTTVHFKQAYSDNCCSSTPLTTFTTSSEKTGYAVGAGIQYALTNNWILRGEYLYAGGFGTVGGTYLATAGSGNSDLHGGSAKLDIQQARFGVDYKFR